MKIAFLIFILFLNLLAQPKLQKTGPYKEIEQIPGLTKAEKTFLKKQQARIEANYQIVNKIMTSPKNEYIQFYDFTNKVIKTIDIDENTFGNISKDNKYVITQKKDTSDYRYITKLYDKKGSLIFNKRVSYRLKVDNPYLLFQIENHASRFLHIYNFNGEQVNEINRMLDEELLGYDIESKLIFRIINTIGGQAIAAFSFDGDLKWTFFVDEAVNKEKVVISKKLQKIYVGNKNELITLDYAGNINNKKELKYDYGSYLALNPSEDFLAALNIKYNESNLLFIIDLKKQNIVKSSFIEELTNNYIVQISFTENYILICNRTKLNWRPRFFTRNTILLNNQAEKMLSYKKKITNPSKVWSHVKPLEFENKLIIKDKKEYDLIELIN